MYILKEKKKFIKYIYYLPTTENILSNFFSHAVN